jgi:hypothetical protein
MTDDNRDSLGVTISAREIYDQIVGLRDDVRSLVQSNENVHQTLDDHEERLRTIERWKYSIPAAVVTALISAGVAVSKTV